MIDLNALVLFAKVVEKQSFVAAARALGVPKSTVSRKVAELEERLGARLLVRTTRAVRLTEAGRSYYDRATRIVADAEEAEALVRDAGETPVGHLRLTTTMAFAERAIAPRMTEFHRRYPRVTVEILATDRRVDLVGEGFDLAIRAGTLDDSSLIARRLAPAGLMVVASPSYLAAHGTPTVIEDLRNHACLLLGTGIAGHQWPLTGPDGPLTVAVTGPLVANDIGILYRACVGGLGIARLPRFLIAEDLAAGRLVPVLPEASPADAGVYLVYPGGRKVPGKVRVFLDFFVGTGEPWGDLGALTEARPP